MAVDRRAKPYYYLSCADVDEHVSDIDGSHCTQEDLARFLISILCKTEGKNTLGYIIAQKYKPVINCGIDSPESLEVFCKSFPQCFIVHPSSTVTNRSEVEVEVTVAVKICSVHVKKMGGCPEDGECGNLHICKFFILTGRCECSEQKQMRCLFGHKLWSDHNEYVLKRHLMDHLKVEEIRTLVKRRKARSLEMRPAICRFYNWQIGCKKPQCGALHLCKHFAIGECKFGEECKRCHDLSEPKVQSILEMYGLTDEDFTWAMTDNQRDLSPAYCALHPSVPTHFTASHGSHQTQVGCSPTISRSDHKHLSSGHQDEHRGGTWLPPPDSQNTYKSSSCTSLSSGRSEESEGSTQPAIFKTLFSRRRGHIVNTAGDGGNDSHCDKKAGQMTGNESSPVAMNPFSYMVVSEAGKPADNQPRKQDAGSGTNEHNLTQSTKVSQKDLSSSVPTTGNPEAFSIQTASRDDTFSQSQDSSFIPIKLGDKNTNSSLGRPVASVIPQVKIKPELGNSVKTDILKPSEDLLFGAKKAERKEPAQVETKPTTNDSTECVAVPEPSTAQANSLQSIIAGLISNVQKLHAKNPGPEMHVMSYLSELAHPDKLNKEIKAANESPEEMEDTSNVAQKSTDRYLSDGEISDSDNDIEADVPTVSKSTQEKVLFEYNHRPTVDLIGEMMDAPEGSDMEATVDSVQQLSFSGEAASKSFEISDTKPSSGRRPYFKGKNRSTFELGDNHEGDIDLEQISSANSDVSDIMSSEGEQIDDNKETDSLSPQNTVLKDTKGGPNKLFKGELETQETVKYSQEIKPLALQGSKEAISMTNKATDSSKCVPSRNSCTTARMNNQTEVSSKAQDKERKSSAAQSAQANLKELPSTSSSRKELPSGERSKKFSQSLNSGGRTLYSRKSSPCGKDTKLNTRTEDTKKPSGSRSSFNTEQPSAPRKSSPSDKKSCPSEKRQSSSNRESLPSSRKSSPSRRRSSPSHRHHSLQNKSPYMRRYSPGNITSYPRNRNASPNTPNTHKTHENDGKRVSTHSRSSSPNHRRTYSNQVSLFNDPKIPSSPRRRSPDPRRRSPDPRRRSPDFRRFSPSHRRPYHHDNFSSENRHPPGNSEIEMDRNPSHQRREDSDRHRSVRGDTRYHKSSPGRRLPHSFGGDQENNRTTDQRYHQENRIRERERSYENDHRREKEERSYENDRRREKEERSFENDRRREKEERSFENDRRREKEEQSFENDRRREKEERSYEDDRRREKEERSYENDRRREKEERSYENDRRRKKEERSYENDRRREKEWTALEREDHRRSREKRTPEAKNDFRNRSRSHERHPHSVERNSRAYSSERHNCNIDEQYARFSRIRLPRSPRRKNPSSSNERNVRAERETQSPNHDREHSAGGSVRQYRHGLDSREGSIDRRHLSDNMNDRYHAEDAEWGAESGQYRHNEDHSGAHGRMRYHHPDDSLDANWDRRDRMSKREHSLDFDSHINRGEFIERNPSFDNGSREGSVVHTDFLDVHHEDFIQDDRFCDNRSPRNRHVVKQGSIRSRLGPSPVPFEDQQDDMDGNTSPTHEQYCQDEIFDINTGESFSENNPRNIIHEEISDRPDNSSSPRKLGRTRKFANYKDWKRAVGNVVKQTPQPDRDVILKYNSQSEEDRAFTPPRFPPHGQASPLSRDKFTNDRRGSSGPGHRDRSPTSSSHHQYRQGPHRRSPVSDPVFHEDHINDDFRVKRHAKEHQGQFGDDNERFSLKAQINDLLDQARHSVGHDASSFHGEDDRFHESEERLKEEESFHCDDQFQEHHKEYHPRKRRKDEFCTSNDAERNRLSPGREHPREFKRRRHESREYSDHRPEGWDEQTVETDSKAFHEEEHRPKHHPHPSKHCSSAKEYQITEQDEKYGREWEGQRDRRHSNSKGHSKHFKSGRGYNKKTGLRIKMVFNRDEPETASEFNHESSHREGMYDDKFPPYLDLDQPSEDIMYAEQFDSQDERDMFLETDVNVEDSMHGDFDSNNNYNEYSDDVGDMIRAQQARVMGSDLRNVLKKRRRSAPMINTEAEPIQIRVQQQDRRSHSSRTKYLNDDGREVVVSIHR